MMKFTVQGFSPDSMQEAMADAMTKAAEYLNDTHDILISLVEQSVVKNQGCQVTLDIVSIPAQAEGPDRDVYERKREQARAMENTARREKTATNWKKRIVDHFRTRRGIEPSASARSHLAHLPEFVMMAEMEREFFNATGQPPPTGAMPVTPAVSTPPLRHLPKGPEEKPD